MNTEHVADQHDKDLYDNFQVKQTVRINIRFHSLIWNKVKDFGTIRKNVTLRTLKERLAEVK